MLFLQLAEWTASPYGPNLRLPVAGNNTWKPWQAEMAELELQLATLRGEPLVLLPSELISSDIGKRTGVAWRYVLYVTRSNQFCCNSTSAQYPCTCV